MHISVRSAGTETLFAPLLLQVEALVYNLPVPSQGNLSSLLSKLRAPRGRDPGDKALHQVSLLGAPKLQALLASECMTHSPACHHIHLLWPVSQTPLEVSVFLTAYYWPFLSPLRPLRGHQRKPSPYLLKARLCFYLLSLPGPFRATHPCILSARPSLHLLRVAKAHLCGGRSCF